MDFANKIVIIIYIKINLHLNVYKIVLLVLINLLMIKLASYAIVNAQLVKILQVVKLVKVSY